MIYVLGCGHTFEAMAGDVEMGERIICEECPDRPTRFVVGRRSS